MFGLYRKILGHPFVYDQVRPRVVGGIDMRPLYELLGQDPPRSSEAPVSTGSPSAQNARGSGERAGRVVLDVGCGTGDALRYLTDFDQYLGIDTDPVAIDAARARYGNRPGVRFECRLLEPSDIAELKPTGVVLSGVFHHLTNDEAEGVLRMVASSPRLVRVVTSDIVFLPGQLFNNVLAMMDRGRFCRHQDAYANLGRSAGFDVERGIVMSSSPTSERVRYFVMSLAPRPAPVSASA